ncbi:Mn-containing catalase [uncultured Ruminococcus sp.]|jgi:manganese containing catalase|nr:Mn-containing catalase [uncultured Ruminococcus sp.]
MEIVSAILYQLTRNLTPEEIKASGFDTYFVDHTTGIYPVAASGTPFTAAYFQSKGDPITDLVEDMAADGTIIQRLQVSKVPILRGFRV